MKTFEIFIKQYNYVQVLSQTLDVLVNEIDADRCLLSMRLQTSGRENSLNSHKYNENCDMSFKRKVQVTMRKNNKRNLIKFGGTGKFLFRDVTFKQKPEILAINRWSIGDDGRACQVLSVRGMGQEWRRVAQDEAGEKGIDQVKILQSLRLYSESCQKVLPLTLT